MKQKNVDTKQQNDTKNNMFNLEEVQQNLVKDFGEYISTVSL